MRAMTNTLSVWPRFCFFAAACVFLAGCGGDGGGDSPDAASDGRCVHEYREPVLHITSAQDESSGEELGEIELWDLSIDEQITSLDSVLSQWRDTDTGAELGENEDRIICTIPCGIGTREGTWSFQASTERYGITTVSTDAEYDEHQGGCPSYSDGGTRIEVQLPPE